MSSKEPKTREELEAAAERWLRNIVGWKRQYVEGLRNEVRDLRERLAVCHGKIRKLELDRGAIQHRSDR